VVIVIIFVAISLIFTVVSSPEYQVKTRLLVTQEEKDFDAYRSLRSADRIAYSLSWLILSQSFLNQVLDSGFEINKSWLPQENGERLKVWQNHVQGRAVKESGILEVTVYHPSPKQAQVLASAINYVLVTKGRDYHGGGDQVQIKVIDPPLLPHKIARPNAWLNIGGGALLGVLVAVAYLVLSSASMSSEDSPHGPGRWKDKLEQKNEKLDLLARQSRDNHHYFNNSHQMRSVKTAVENETRPYRIHTMYDYAAWN
jgi:capsular polysaccharide biosynthesis protein